MPATIVWVDDDNDLLESVVEPLKWAGNHVIAFRTLHEARMGIQQIRDADLLLLDMILPTGLPEERMPEHFTGLELLKELRRGGVRTLVIILSVVNHSDETSPERLRELDVARIMRKPVLPSDLRKAVESVLGTEAVR